ncbi:MAG: phosphate regulon sensor histidine kinase PhoR [Gammaproteobacteria bacterium]
MITRAWKLELSRLGLVLAAGVALGLLIGELAWCLVVAMGAYLTWTMVNLYRLEHWLRTSKKFQPPYGKGIWAEVLDHFYQLQKRNRKRKRKLARILKLFQRSTKALPDGAVVLNTNKEIQWVNAAGERMLGLSVPRDVGHRLENFLRHQSFKTYLTEERWLESIDLPSPTQRDRTLSIRMVPFARDLYLLVVRDITEQLRVEQSQRDFVGNVSHELRTPLTVLNGFIETLLEEDREPRLQKPLNAMGRQISRMSNLVEDLLLLEKLNSGGAPRQHEEVDMPALVRNAVEDAMLLSDGRHRIQIGRLDDLGMLGDYSELGMALSNLLSNAVRYTPKEGEISVAWWHHGAEAILEVQDSGDGIPPHHLSRLSERFYRVDAGRSRDQGGTGLGLAIVQQIVERHHGRLDIFSEVSRGSRFRLVFPDSMLLQPDTEQDDAA